eukprot:gb/GECG01002948.1/.p1 GENE.gb/GECG01002948.1/~~gb/GECG01002948.1/.p1  ORF type:complete len:235 (+),score=22.67 gb/GECG01002948.1/:1-705(+)
MAHHQVLAIDRAEQQKVVRVSLSPKPHSEKRRDGMDVSAARLFQYLTKPSGETQTVGSKRGRRSVEEENVISLNSELSALLEETAKDTWKRLLFPSISRDIRSTLTASAKSKAIEVFGANLRSLLSMPPLRHKVILGIDPGYKHGCKVVVIDEVGSVLDSCTVYPHPPYKQWGKAIDRLSGMIKKFQVDIIAGNARTGFCDNSPDSAGWPGIHCRFRGGSIRLLNVGSSEGRFS